jgi:type II secretory pathway pseudopilin PulG
MDTLLLGITVVSLIVALVMSVTAWRLMREEKRRAAARIAALSAAAGDGLGLDDFPEQPIVQATVKPAPARMPWKPATIAPSDPSDEGPVNAHVGGLLGSAQVERSSGGRQRGLAVATVMFFVVITAGFLSTFSGPEASATAAVTADAPLELVSLTHTRQNDRLAVSGLVRNPASGKPVEKLSAVVFLFDRSGAFIASSKAHVDFLKLGAGDESPFVVALDAPGGVTRYRVSFRTDDGVMPHIDRRRESPVSAEGERPINVTLK